MKKKRGRRLRRKGQKAASAFLAAMLFLTGCSFGKATPEQRVIKEELAVEGIQGEYELLLLTDVHAVKKKEGSGATTEAARESKYAEERFSMFQNEQGVSSAEQLEGWIEYADREKVDGVLLGGDIIDVPSPENLEFLKEQLSLLEAPCIYTPGNHDWTYPWEYMTEKGRKEYLPLLAPYMEENTAIHSMDFGEFVVAAVDNSPGQVNGEVLEEYGKILKGDKPVIVLVHVPFLTQSILPKAKESWKGGVVIGGGNYGGIYPSETSQKFVDMTTAKDSPVAAVLAGHVHFYDKGVIEGEKDVIQIVGDAGFHGSAVQITVKGTD